MTAQAGDTLVSIAVQKHDLRRRLRAARAQLPGAARQAAARRLLRHLLHSRWRPHDGVVGLYLSAASELPTDGLRRALHARGIALAAPHIASHGRMHFVRLLASSRLMPGAFRTRAIAGRRVRVPRRMLRVLLLPLVGFDRQGARLGAGGGYYDRFLARRPGHPRLTALGLAYALQEVDRVPHEPWDVRLDAVVTERGILSTHSTRLRWPTG